MGLDAGAQSADSQDEAIARLHKPQSTFVKISGYSGYFPWNHGKFICKGGRKMVMFRLTLLPELWV